MTRKEIYKAQGIEYRDGKILSPIGWIPELLINGNAKLGKGVWTFSTLAGTGNYNAIVCGKEVTIKGTCNCDCNGCYAKTGFYRMQSTVNALAIRTVIARDYPAFMAAAIKAQVEADKILLCRIHAAGDFFNNEYIQAWKDIVSNCKDVMFWTYTKNADAENAFNNYSNANIVRSIIPDVGLNFGHCGYVMDVYKALQEKGEKVHVCHCTLDKQQHCVNCKGCAENNYVLFVEHSTDYKAEKDPDFARLYSLVMTD